jgi:hypothetical protein
MRRRLTQLYAKQTPSWDLVLDEIHPVVALTSLHNQRCIETTVGRSG